MNCWVSFHDQLKSMDHPPIVTVRLVTIRRCYPRGMAVDTQLESLSLDYPDEGDSNRSHRVFSQKRHKRGAIYWLKICISKIIALIWVEIPTTAITHYLSWRIPMGESKAGCKHRYWKREGGINSFHDRASMNHGLLDGLYTAFNISSILMRTLKLHLAIIGVRTNWAFACILYSVAAAGQSWEASWMAQ